MVPSEWGLDETVDIIEVGLGRNAALIWRENAVRQNLPQSAEVVTRSDLAECGLPKVGYAANPYTGTGRPRR